MTPTHKKIAWAVAVILPVLAFFGIDQIQIIPNYAKSAELLELQTTVMSLDKNHKVLYREFLIEQKGRYQRELTDNQIEQYRLETDSKPIPPVLLQQETQINGEIEKLEQRISDINQQIFR